MRPSAPLSASGTIACAVLLHAACGDLQLIPPDDDSSTSTGLGGGLPVAASSSGGGGAGEGGSGGLGGEGDGLPPVWVGLVANPSVDADDDEHARRAREVEAVTSTYAIGASIFATKRAWANADAAGLAADAQLASVGCGVDTPVCRPSALTLAVVDGLFDGRPADLVGEDWASEASLASIDDAVDATLDSLGDSLQFLAIGARVDRWLGEHEEDEAGLEELLARAADRALIHPKARADLLVGVGLSREAALSTGGTATSLRSIGNATMASLFPGLGEVADGTSIPSPGSIALDLDAIDQVDPGRPVALVEVGYPSAAEIGSDDAAQGLFFDALFDALESRRPSFPLIVVSRLHDLDAEACAAEGVALGEESEQVLAYRCSTGARDARDAPKPAWASFVVGAARLATGATPLGP